MRSTLLSVCALSLLLAGCDDMMWGERSDRFTENFSHSYTLKPGGRLSVENMNGSVEISGWDRDTVEITGAKYAATEDLLKSTRIDIQQSADGIQVRTIRPSGVRGNVGARYTIRVPKRIELDRVVSSNGHVEARDLEGPARIRTSNGAVRVNNSKGPLDVETSNGGIDINDHAGAVTGRTSNGHIRVDLSNPEQGRPVRLESSNGGITLKMRELNGNSIRMSTSNARIDLTLPENANAQLRASTSNGSFHTDLPVQGSITKNRADGKIGSGGPYVELSTSNGRISLQKL
jgi:DUF4097 and DUF4098 domain-containing protein YvlB